MGINRVRAATDEFFHETDCGGTVKLKPWIPRDTKGSAASGVRRGVCDRCGKAFFDPGDLDVDDDALEAGHLA